MSEIVSAVDDMIRSGNTSAIFAPVVDSEFLTVGPSAIAARFMELDPETAIRRGQYKKVGDMLKVIASRLYRNRCYAELIA